MVFRIVIVALVIFHTVEGHEVAVNPDHVTSLVSPREADGKSAKLFTDGVKCMINLTDGRFLNVAENCDQVKRQLEEAKK